MRARYSAAATTSPTWAELGDQLQQVVGVDCIQRLCKITAHRLWLIDKDADRLIGTSD
ncbi:MAG: hypothetical protein QGH76_01155 [Phycisphaerales bacterium]|nr:hypothetical protein [Phycisphaerales bacterium]